MSESVLPVISPFLDSLKFEKRYSPLTIRSYQDDLTQFFTFIQQQYGEIECKQISSAFIRSWLVTLKDAKRTGKTISRKLSTLQSFFKYQLRVGLLDNIPLANIQPPRLSKRLPVYVQQKDMEKDIEFPDTWEGRTDQLLIRIFYHTGMRLSELTGLKEMHIDAGNSVIKVLGKGNKERLIPVNNELITAIADYRNNKRKEYAACNTDFLLVNKKGRKLYPKYVYRVVHAYLGQLTTLEKRSPHVLRHTFATHLTNNGADLNAVKELLGHASLAATQIYTHNTIDKLKDIHKKAHPKS